MMSGGSTIGGETTTFSAAFSIFIISLNSRMTLFGLTSVALRSGVLPVKTGGISSKRPPSGVPTLAQPKQSAATRVVAAAHFEMDREWSPIVSVNFLEDDAGIVAAKAECVGERGIDASSAGLVEREVHAVVDVLVLVTLFVVDGGRNNVVID